jgi:probable phosphoglycerate mutase
MDTVEVWLVRHGETALNEQGRLSGWNDVKLTECGRRQALHLRDVLAGESFDCVWSSDLDRALETSRLAWGEPRVDARLREIHFGTFEAVEYATLSEEHKTGLREFAGFEAPGGEAIEKFVERVNDFLDGLAPGRHLVFAHGGVIRAVMRQTGPDRFLSTGSILVIDWTGRKTLFVRENELGTSSALVRDSERRSGCRDEGGNHNG